MKLQQGGTTITQSVDLAGKGCLDNMLHTHTPLSWAKRFVLSSHLFHLGKTLWSSMKKNPILTAISSPKIWCSLSKPETYSKLIRCSKWLNKTTGTTGHRASASRCDEPLACCAIKQEFAVKLPFEKVKSKLINYMKSSLIEHTSLQCHCKKTSRIPDGLTLFPAILGWDPPTASATNIQKIACTASTGSSCTIGDVAAFSWRDSMCS